MRVLGSDPDVPVSELLFELPIQEMLYELLKRVNCYGFVLRPSGTARAENQANRSSRVILRPCSVSARSELLSPGTSQKRPAAHSSGSCCRAVRAIIKLS